MRGGLALKTSVLCSKLAHAHTHTYTILHTYSHITHSHTGAAVLVENRTVTNEEINAIQEQLRESVANELGVELR